MKREEFEAVLKRALDLQGHQAPEGEDSLTEEDLANAAQRLKISPEIMHQAFLDVRRSRKRFRVKGTPEEVREAFLKTYLLQPSQLPYRLPSLKIDRQALQIGRTMTVRVQDPQFPEIDAEVSFTADGADHTLVHWVGNSTLSLRTTLFISAIPILVAVMMAGPMIVAAAPILTILSMLVLPLFILVLMLHGCRRNARRVDGILSEYFENIQILTDLKDRKSEEQELLELRAWKERMSAQPQTAIQSGPPPSGERTGEAESPPPPPRMERES